MIILIYGTINNRMTNNSRQDDDIKDDDKSSLMKDRNGGLLSINMEQRQDAEKREIIKETDKYTLQKVYDERLSDDYYELWETHVMDVLL